MTTAVALFRKHLLVTLPDDPIVATLIPEQDRYWRQNPAESVLKFQLLWHFPQEICALIQLEANDADVKPVEREASTRTSLSGKVKVHDVCLWLTGELTKVGCLVSLSTLPKSENEPFG